MQPLVLRNPHPRIFSVCDTYYKSESSCQASVHVGRTHLNSQSLAGSCDVVSLPILYQFRSHLTDEPDNPDISLESQVTGPSVTVSHRASFLAQCARRGINFAKALSSGCQQAAACVHHMIVKAGVSRFIKSRLAFEKPGIGSRGTRLRVIWLMLHSVTEKAKTCRRCRHTHKMSCFHPLCCPRCRQAASAGSIHVGCTAA